MTFIYSKTFSKCGVDILPILGRVSTIFREHLDTPFLVVEIDVNLAKFAIIFLFHDHNSSIRCLYDMFYASSFVIEISTNLYSYPRLEHVVLLCNKRAHNGTML